MTLEQLLHSTGNYISESIYYFQDNFIHIENQEWLQLNVGFVVFMVLCIVAFWFFLIYLVEEYEYQERLKKIYQEDLARERERKNQNG